MNNTRTSLDPELPGRISFRLCRLLDRGEVDGD
jgi:hypothetical protein